MKVFEETQMKSMEQVLICIQSLTNHESIGKQEAKEIGALLDELGFWIPDMPCLEYASIFKKVEYLSEVREKIDSIIAISPLYLNREIITKLIYLKYYLHKLEDMLQWTKELLPTEESFTDAEYKELIERFLKKVGIALNPEINLLVLELKGSLFEKVCHKKLSGKKLLQNVGEVINIDIKKIKEELEYSNLIRSKEKFATLFVIDAYKVKHISLKEEKVEHFQKEILQSVRTN